MNVELLFGKAVLLQMMLPMKIKYYLLQQKFLLNHFD